MTTLPSWGLTHPNRDPPHRHHVLVERIVAEVRIRLCSNWPETRWWLTASYIGARAGFRASRGLETASPKVMAQWRADLEANRVRLEP